MCAQYSLHGLMLFCKNPFTKCYLFFPLINFISQSRMLLLWMNINRSARNRKWNSYQMNFNALNFNWNFHRNWLYANRECFSFFLPYWFKHVVMLTAAAKLRENEKIEMKAVVFCCHWLKIRTKEQNQFNSSLNPV